MSRTRIVLRHDPASVAGLITHRRGSRATTRRLAGAIFPRLRDIRTPPAPGFLGRHWLFAAKAARRVWGTLPALTRALSRGRGGLSEPRRGGFPLRASSSA